MALTVDIWCLKGELSNDNYPTKLALGVEQDNSFTDAWYLPELRSRKT
jgi:hypothetical protein